MSQKPFPLTDLINDILILVFKKLFDLSFESLRAISGVNHRFYQLAVPILYRDTLKIYNRAHDETIVRLNNPRSQLSRFVRSITLNSFSSPSREAELFIATLRKLPSLEKITITRAGFQIYQGLFDFIDAELPHVKVSVMARIQHRHRDGSYDGWEEGEMWGENGMKGFTSKRLWSLDVHINWTFSVYGQGIVKRSLERIVKGSPNLKHLVTDASGAAKCEGVKQDLDLDLSEEDTLPQLKSLCYIPLSKRAIETWGRAGGWEDLTTLQLNRPELLKSFLAAGLPRLETLVIRLPQKGLGDDDSFMDDVLDLKAPLRSLHLYDRKLNAIPVRFISQFGETLEELVITGLGESTQDKASQVEQMQWLTTACPNLKHLCIRPSTLEGEEDKVPEEFLQLVAERLPRLEVLGIAFPRRLCRALEFPASCIDVLNSAINSTNSSACLRRVIFAQKGCISTHGLQNPHHPVCHVGHRFSRLSGSEPFRLNGWDEYVSEGKILEKCKSEAFPKSLVDRPFSRYYNGVLEFCPRDIVWAAMALGPGPEWKQRLEWARNELLPLGLLREEHFENVKYPNDIIFLDRILLVTKNHKDTENVRKMVKKELRYWKKRWELTDKYGEYFLLYDVLYPKEESELIEG